MDSWVQRPYQEAYYTYTLNESISGGFWSRSIHEILLENVGY